MADPGGTERAPLIGRLAEDCRRFAFFQAVQLLERAHPEAPPIGGTERASAERVRFRGMPSLAFPPGDIDRITPVPGRDGRPERYHVVVTFLGMYGPSSPLPTHYTERLIAADVDREAARQFLDLFNHRLLALLYRVWKKYRYYAQYEEGAADELSRDVYALIGLELAAIHDRGAINWIRLLPYAGLVSLFSHSASMIAGIVSHYFDGLPARVEEWVERRVRIPEEQRSRLGAVRTTLGEDMVLGESVADVSGKFRLHLGPLDFAEFADFLPDGRHFRALRELVRVMLRDPLEFDVALSLDRAAVPRWTLGAAAPCRLGWSSWLGEPPAGDPTVVIGMRLEEGWA